MRIKTPSKRMLLTWGIPILILALLPLGLGGNQFVMGILILCLIWGAVTTNWDLLMGYGGIFSFGQIAFFTIGAYGSALIAKNFGISPWLTMWAGGSIAALVGFLIGLPCLRLKGVYPAVVTFALHETLAPVIRAGEPIGTGGAGSMVGIPPLAIGDFVFSVTNRVPYYYVALGIFIGIMVATYLIIHSRFGLGFVALRDASPAAKSLGVDDYRAKLILFATSAFMTGLMGGFYAHYLQLLSHYILGLDNFVLALVILVIGGLGRFPGAAIAAFIFTFLNEALRPLETGRAIVLGSIVIAAIIATPQGIMGIPDMVRSYFRKRKPLAEQI